MFGIGGTELMIIVVVVLLLFGPDKIPEFMNTVKKAVRMYNDAKTQVTDVVQQQQIITPEDLELLRDPLGTKKLQGTMQSLLTPQRATLLSGGTPPAPVATDATGEVVSDSSAPAPTPSHSAAPQTLADSIWSSLATPAAPATPTPAAPASPVTPATPTDEQDN